MSSRRIDASACGTDSITVTHTARPASRSRATSSLRFSSRLAITRSGARAAILARSGFLVPRTRVTARPAGRVHQSVAPISRPGAETATASVSEGTSDTTRRAGPVSSTGWPRSSRHTATRQFSQDGLHVTPVLAADHEERLADLAGRAVPDRLHQGREDVPAAGRRLLEAPQRGRATSACLAWKLASRSSWLCFSASAARASSTFAGAARSAPGSVNVFTPTSGRLPSCLRCSYSRHGLLDQVGELVQDERAPRPVLEPTEPAELRAVGVELVKANEADFIGAGSLPVTAEAGTGKTAQDGVAGVEALDREQVPCAVKALGVADVHDPVPLRLAEGKDLARTPVLGWSEHGDIYLDLGPVGGSETTPAPTSPGKPPNISGPAAIA